MWRRPRKSNLRRKEHFYSKESRWVSLSEINWVRNEPDFHDRGRLFPNGKTGNIHWPGVADLIEPMKKHGFKRRDHLGGLEGIKVFIFPLEEPVGHWTANGNHRLAASRLAQVERVFMTFVFVPYKKPILLL